MTSLNTITSYIDSAKVVRCAMISIAFLLLSGCLGGTVAQQLARSIATSIADNAVANAMDVNEEATSKHTQRPVLANRPPSDLALALTHTSFRKAPHPVQVIAKQTDEKPIQLIKSNALVRAKVFNLIIGEEKQLVFEKARSIGALNLPSQQEWESWYVASGKIEHSETPITFLIPPSLGKPISDQTIIIELANLGDLNIARYNANDAIVYQAMDETNTRN